MFSKEMSLGISATLCVGVVGQHKTEAMIFLVHAFVLRKKERKNLKLQGLGIGQMWEEL